MFIVFKKLLRGFERLLFYTQIFVEADQVPVQIQYARHRGDHLQFEIQIVYLGVVLGHPDIPVIHRPPQALQQILRNVEIQIPLRVWVQRIRRRVQMIMLSREIQLHGGARRKGLRIRDRIGLVIRDQRRSRAHRGQTLRRGRMADLKAGG